MSEVVEITFDRVEPTKVFDKTVLMMLKADHTAKDGTCEN